MGGGEESGQGWGEKASEIFAHCLTLDGRRGKAEFKGKI